MNSNTKNIMNSEEIEHCIAVSRLLLKYTSISSTKDIKDYLKLEKSPCFWELSNLARGDMLTTGLLMKKLAENTTIPIIKD